MRQQDYFFLTSKANASDLLENIEEMFVVASNLQQLQSVLAVSKVVKVRIFKMLISL